MTANNDKKVICLRHFPGKEGRVSGVLDGGVHVYRLGDHDSWDEVRTEAMHAWSKLFPDARVLIQCPSFGYPRTPLTFMDTKSAVDALTKSRIMETIYFDGMNKAQMAIDAYAELLRLINGDPLDKYDL